MSILLTGTTNGNCQKIIPANLVYKAEALTGEGSIWHPDRNTLFWVDIEGQKLYEYIPEKDDCKQWCFDRMISTVVPETKNTVVVALQDEIVRLDLTTNKRTSITPINDENGTLRCNDGKCDPEGRLWIGTMTLDAPKGSAALHRVHHTGEVVTLLEGVTISNGIVWSHDKKYMYYADTPTGKIDRFIYDSETGDIELDGIAITIDPSKGSPDGMTIDENGNLWVAQWGGYGIYCYNPHTGELITKVEVPAPNVTSCAFGGENLDTLYITTACGSLSEEDKKKYPLSGSLFSCKPGVKGVVAHRFGK